MNYNLYLLCKKSLYRKPVRLSVISPIIFPSSFRWSSGGKGVGTAMQKILNKPVPKSPSATTLQVCQASPATDVSASSDVKSVPQKTKSPSQEPYTRPPSPEKVNPPRSLVPPHLKVTPNIVDGIPKDNPVSYIERIITKQEKDPSSFIPEPQKSFQSGLLIGAKHSIESPKINTNATTTSTTHTFQDILLPPPFSVTNSLHFVPDVPIPPPLPPKVLTKPQKFTSDVKPINPEILENQIKNLRPSKPVVPLNTKIDSDTNLGDLSRADLLEEAVRRSLITKDNNATVVNITTEFDTNILVGSGIYKIVKNGAGFFVEVIKKSVNNTKTFNVTIENNPAVKILIPNISKNNEVSVLPAATVKHLLVGIQNIDGNYLGLGYLTSKFSTTLIMNFQFKQYQDNVKTNTLKNLPDNTSKMQYFVSFKQIKIIKQHDVQEAKGGTEYLSFMKNTMAFSDLIKQLQMHKAIEYDITEYTDKHILDACKENDKQAHQNKGYIETQDQEEERLRGLERQKQLAENRKALKLREKDNTETKHETTNS